jgi:hypothetical protein
VAKLPKLSSVFLSQKSSSDAGLLGEELVYLDLKKPLSLVPDNLLKQISRMGKVGKKSGSEFW